MCILYANKLIYGINNMPSQLFGQEIMTKKVTYDLEYFPKSFKKCMATFQSQIIFLVKGPLAFH